MVELAGSKHTTVVKGKAVGYLSVLLWWGWVVLGVSYKVLASLMVDLSLSPVIEKSLRLSCFYAGLLPELSEVSRCRGGHACRAVWPGEAEILSASIKPLPALAALNTKSTPPTGTNQPLPVTFSLAVLFLALLW